MANIQEEMFYAARGKYMELVTGRRAAEDDEHTEVSFIHISFRCLASISSRSS